MASVSFMLIQTYLLSPVFYLLPLTSPAHGLSRNVQRITHSNNRRWWLRNSSGEEEGGGSSFVHGCTHNSGGWESIIERHTDIFCPDLRHLPVGLPDPDLTRVVRANPRIFRRMGPNDCIVNDGNPLESGVTLPFVYANSFSYPMAIARAKMC